MGVGECSSQPIKSLATFKKRYERKEKKMTEGFLTLGAFAGIQLPPSKLGTSRGGVSVQEKGRSSHLKVRCSLP